MSIHHLCRPLISIKRRHRNHDLFRANRMYNCCQKFRCAIAAQHLRFFYRWLQICCDLLNQFSTSLLRVYHDMFQSLPQSIFQRIRSSQWIDIHRKVIFYVVIVYISPMNILITVHTFSSFIEHQPTQNRQIKARHSHKIAVRYRSPFALLISSYSTGLSASPMVGFLTILPK